MMNRYDAVLQHLSHKGRYRELTKSSGIDFASNDYLALAKSPQLQQCMISSLMKGIPIGSTGSRLLTGNHDSIINLELLTAQLYRSERALYLNSGYSANLALLSTLPKRGDIIIYDELSHASIIDGSRLSKANSESFSHNSLNELRDKIKQWRSLTHKGTPWIVIESIYSMNGDLAPLDEIYSIVNEYDGILIIDEAHATGVFGENGLGLCESISHQTNVITLHTCGKALGVSGALITLNETLYQYFVNHARNFIYTTAPSPILAECVMESLKLTTQSPNLRNKLMGLIDFTHHELQTTFQINHDKTHIIPFMITDIKKCMTISSRMQAEGFMIYAIRPPTVPEGQSRLRLSISLNVNQHDIKRMIQTLSNLLEPIHYE